MFEQLRHVQKSLGAIVDETGTPLRFNAEIAAIAAAKTGVAVADRCHWGCIAVSDADRLTFLHNQSTNDIQNLKPGQGCETVFVTSTARTIDLASVYVLDDTLWLLVSPNRCQTLLTQLDRFIFFSDRVILSDQTANWATFSLVGPESDRLLTSLGATALIGQPLHTHQPIEIQGIPTRIAVGSGLGLPGYTLFVPTDTAAPLWDYLIAAGALPLGSEAWETLRVEQGRPAPDAELTDDYNPLEAGLWHTISFSKGCYIGQETIARLNTYNGVKQRLWGIQLQTPVAPGTLITLGNDKIGKLTSVIPTAEGAWGLGYIRSKAGGVGLAVQVGETSGEVKPLPYVNHPE